jgi:glycerol-3-phosphate dehydrogenase
MLAAGRPLRASHRVAARRRRAAAPATPAAALRVAGGKLTSTRQSPKKQAAAIAKKQRVPGRLRWCRDPKVKLQTGPRGRGVVTKRRIQSCTRTTSSVKGHTSASAVPALHLRWSHDATNAAELAFGNGCCEGKN